MTPKETSRFFGDELRAEIRRCVRRTTSDGRLCKRLLTCVDDSSNQAEQDNLADRDHPESLGEVSGISHFGNEARKSDLTDKSVTDVQKGTHSSDESRALRWNSKNSRGSSIETSKRNNRVWIRVVILWVSLDCGEDGGQQNGDECEEC